VNVPTSIGFLHHYRVCEFGGDDCVHTDSRVDRSVYRYRDLLVRNVEKVVQKLAGACHLETLQGSILQNPVSAEAFRINFPPQSFLTNFLPKTTQIY
jgi:hypothetical protein